MTAATKNRNTPERGSVRRGFGLAAAKTLYAGVIACLDSSGNLTPGSTATGLKCLGRSAALYDNSAGSAGDITGEVESGIFRFDNSASADAITDAEIGEVCYIVDDQTVAKTNGSATRSPAGIIEDVDSVGVWVRMGADALVAPAGALLAANNLSDVDTAATARANLGLAIGTNVQAYNAKLARLQIQNDLTAHTGDGACATSGVNLVAGGTGISGLTLAAPVAGDRCEIRIDSLSSGSVVVTTAAGVTFDGSNNTATLDAANEALILVYKSATEWQIVENVGAVALSSV